MPDDLQREWVTRVLGVQFSTTPSSGPELNPIGLGAFASLRLEWENTKKSVAGQLAALRSTAASAYAGDPLVGSLDRLDTIVARFNEGLGDHLGDLANAADPESRKRAAAAAQDIASRYETYADTDPLIALIEINPLKPISVALPLSTTLGKIRQALSTLTY